MAKLQGSRSWPYLLPRLGLGLVFVWAGAVKLLDIQAFGVVLARYSFLPEALLPPAAVGLPLMEVVAGLGLMAGVRGSLSLITGMLALFAGVLWFGVLQGLEIDCGCFSPDELASHDGLRQALYRDLAMLAVAAHLYIWGWRHAPARTGSAWPRPASPRPHQEEIAS
ncbi:MAG: DoxX family protein [Desulfarculus sp.]|nr:DoxX family protein [Desulfarculus sp.]